MFTIKAYTPNGFTNIYEAIEVRINPNKTQLDFIRPNSDLVECLLVNGTTDNYSIVYIENQSGKTIESLRGSDPSHR